MSYGLNLNPEDKYVLNMSAIVQKNNLTENLRWEMQHNCNKTMLLIGVEGLKGSIHRVESVKKRCYTLGRRPDFLPVLVPLQINSGVGQVNHQADLPAFVHLICWF